MTGRHFVQWFGGAALLACASGSALAQTYPTQPVKMLVPYAAGGVGDITARVLAQRLSQALGQQVIIDNRPSAGQIVATEAAMKAEPDGYTLLWLNQGHAVSVSLFKSLPYDPVRDFAPISTVGFFGLALLVNSDSPHRSLKEFIAAAKASPGKFNVGTTSIGGTQFIAAELFKSMAGLEFQTVPFKATRVNGCFKPFATSRDKTCRTTERAGVTGTPPTRRNRSAAPAVSVLGRIHFAAS